MASSGLSMFGAGSEASGEGEEMLAGQTVEETSGDVEEEEQKGIGSLFGPPTITIVLHEKEFKDQFGGADVEAKSSPQATARRGHL